jgi:hypothetical protein
MNQACVPTATRLLKTHPSRRDVMRGLMVTVMGLAALRLPKAGEARKRKKPKKCKKCGPCRSCKKGKCKPKPNGTSIGSVSVPASGAAVSTPVLAQGQRYRLRATGFWKTNATHGNDAYAAFNIGAPDVPVLTFQGVRLGLSVDGGSPDQWGSYTTSHIYEREVTGQGTALSLRYTDPVTADNSGSLLVEVICQGRS